VEGTEPRKERGEKREVTIVDPAFSCLEEESMIVKIGFFSSNPGDLEKGINLWESDMVPLLKKQQGFRKAYIATALDEPGGLIVQIWESKKDEDAWRSSPEYLGVLQKLQPLIPELRIERDFVLSKEV
jgi:heme-degrading monooxygenase HmoA